MNIRYNRGPSTLPWGISAYTYVRVPRSKAFAVYSELAIDKDRFQIAIHFFTKLVSYSIHQPFISLLAEYLALFGGQVANVLLTGGSKVQVNAVHDCLLFGEIRRDPLFSNYSLLILNFIGNIQWILLFRRIFINLMNDFRNIPSNVNV